MTRFPKNRKPSVAGPRAFWWSRVDAFRNFLVKSEAEAAQILKIFREFVRV